MSDQIRKVPDDAQLQELWKDMGDGTFAKVRAVVSQDMSAANTARTPATEVLPVQMVDDAGNVSRSGRVVIKTAQLKRPADTNAYATNDIVGCNVAVVGVTAQAVTGLCLVEVAAGVIDTTLFNGDYVTLASIVGTTEANVSAFITKVDATHFTIPVTFVNAYTSGGTIAKMLQMDVTDVNNQSGYINWLKLLINSTTVTNAQFDVYMYSTPFAAILDNAQQTLLAANYANGTRIGTVLLSTGGTGSDSAMAIIDNIAVPFVTEAASKRLYFRVVMTAQTGYIPASGSLIRIVVGAELR
jgi:hypothetical protein